MWRSVPSGTMYYYIPPEVNLPMVTKAVCFDLDWTLVRPLSTKFPKNYSDNIIMPKRVQTLQKYISSGCTIVIFTNQKITRGATVSDKIKRMDDIISKFKMYKIPLVIFMSIADDEYRKPNIGMYKFMYTLMPNIKQGFYCGDAAGRPNDFSNSDLEFAKNCGMSFFLPEDIFK